MRDLGFERPDWGGLPVLEDSVIATVKFPAHAPKMSIVDNERIDLSHNLTQEASFSRHRKTYICKMEKPCCLFKKTFKLHQNGPLRPPPLRKCKLGKRSSSSINSLHPGRSLLKNAFHNVN
jgi:hypothetical protein